MALLQISEPGQSDAPHERRLAVGIDLGTTNSLVAAVRSGEARPIVDGEGRAALASAVRWDAGGGVAVGHAADASEADAGTDGGPGETIRSAKRLMGKGEGDLADSWLGTHHDFDTSGPVPRFVTPAGPKSAVEVSAAILSALRERAEDALGGALAGAVVTVPAYFDDAQRQATKDAAALAGLPVLRLLNEPTAAAVAYGLDRAEEGLVAIYDLGGGTFDVSLLRLNRGVFEVLATAGDTSLGGDDVDNLVVELLLERAGVGPLPDGPSRARAKGIARVAKERLSDADSVDVDLELDDEAGAELVRWRGTLSRDELETRIAPLVERTLGPCRRVLRDAGVTRDELVAVVMVGGSTRVPLVRRRVSAFFDREVLTDIDPDEVVAVGAAIQADALAGNRTGDDLLLLDVIPLSLGLETMGGLAEKIVARNTPIPIARAQEFTTYKDGQTAMSLHVVQGERELVADCRSLARFELRGFPARVAGALRIQVLFQVDADGLLTVSALERESGTVASVDVKPSYGLTDDEIEAMLRASTEHAGDDAVARALAERRVEAARALEAIESALAADGDEHLSADERAEIERLAGAVRALVDDPGADRDGIDAAVHALEHGAEAFVERRMNASVRRMMAGRDIDEMAAGAAPVRPTTDPA